MKMLSPKIFEFFAAEAKVEKVRKINKKNDYSRNQLKPQFLPLSGCQDQLLVKFHNLEATHIGSMGTTVAELRK